MIFAFKPENTADFAVQNFAESGKMADIDVINKTVVPIIYSVWPDSCPPRKLGLCNIPLAHGPRKPADNFLHEVSAPSEGD
jgi:hypothetical protein